MVSSTNNSFPSRSFFTKSLLRSHDALFAPTARVLPQVKMLLRTTISSLFVRDRPGCPLASAFSSIPPHSIRISKTVRSSLKARLNSSVKSVRPLSAHTAIMQSPRGVRWVSFVISKVVLCFAVTLGWPFASIVSLSSIYFGI